MVAADTRRSARPLRLRRGRAAVRRGRRDRRIPLRLRRRRSSDHRDPRRLRYPAPPLRRRRAAPGDQRRRTASAASATTRAGRRVAEDGARRRRALHVGPAGSADRGHHRQAEHTRRTGLHVDALGELAGRRRRRRSTWDSADPLGPLARARRHHADRRRPPLGAGRRAGRGPVASRTGSTPRRAGTATRGVWPRMPDAVALGYRGELTVDGLVWLRHRAYDPATRAFLQRRTRCRRCRAPRTPANPYHYAGNDPVNAVDPLGLRPSPTPISPASGRRAAPREPSSPVVSARSRCRGCPGSIPTGA